MSGEITNIGALLEVRAHPTVVRLADLESEAAQWLSDSFLVTPEIKTHLGAVRQMLERGEGGGAFLIGHYGSGKSHLLGYLTQQLRAGALVSAPVRVVPISLVNFSAANRLEEIVCSALGLKPDQGDRRLVWDGFEGDGTLLILDELSEFLRSKEDARAFNEDVRFLQFLGEWSRDRRFWILAAMQEGIEHTGELEHSLYRKIKDRYPLRLLLTPAHVQTLIADSILVKREGYGEAVQRLVGKLRESFSPRELDLPLLQGIYPLHPATLTLLEEIRDRFSQTRGVVDFVVTTLRGDPARGVEPFLERPWGELITPDRIVDHFRDLFELQPEFIPLAQRLFPWYRKHLDELFDKPLLRDLAQRLLRLLVLVHLSPARETLTARQASAWLLFSASRVEPARNREIIEKVLARLADQGRFVALRKGGYRLELREDGSAAFETRLKREMAALQGQEELVLELLAPLLPEGQFNPFTLPRERYQHRRLTWRFHERRYAVWCGEKEPEPLEEEGVVGLCIRLPWGEAAAAPGCYTLIPAPIRPGADLVELAALARMREHPLGMEQSQRLAQRIRTRLPAWQGALRNAWLEAALVTPEGKREPPPRFDLKGAPEGWLESLALWAMRRTWPAFERFAPAHGPLPKEAWRRLMRFAAESDLLAEQADEYVLLIREAYLVPMGLLRRKGRGYTIPGNLERHELVTLVTPLLEHDPSPGTIARHLACPIYGLVPDQVKALLIFLLLQGELDIVKEGSSYRDTFETLPNPLQYDRVVPGSSLGGEQLRAMEQLCGALQVPAPRQWSILAQRRIATRLRSAAQRATERLLPLVTRLQGLPQGEGLLQRLRTHLATWRALAEQGDPLQGLRQFLYEAKSVPALLAELEEFTAMEQRLTRLLTEIERYRHLLQHAALAGTPAAAALEALGEMPPLDQPDRLEQWLRQAGAIYADHKESYRAAHQRWWHSVQQHPIWQWQPPALAASRHLGLEQQLTAVESCRRELRSRCCRGLVNLDYQPVCSCGFDGESAPVAELLQRFGRLSREIEEQVQLFFRQESVRRRLREWQEQGVDPGSAVQGYLEGAQPLPEIGNIELLDQHLAGLDLVRELDESVVLELLEQHSWEPAELLARLERLFAETGGQRIRFRRRSRGGPVPESVARWCGTQALRHGIPLPPGLDREALRTISGQLGPEQVGTAALRRLDEIGLDASGEKRILEWLLEGQIPLPEEPLPEGSATRAVQIFRNRERPSTPAALATASSTLYRHFDIMHRLAGDAWLEWLEELARTPLAGVVPLPEALDRCPGHQWLLIDCLGLPLLEPLRAPVTELFSAWAPPLVTFAEVSRDSSTDGCYRQLLADGINHPMAKLDVVDEQIHAAATGFEELVTRIAAELRIAVKKVLPQLDPGRPLLIFADHGFRLTADGGGYRHGGDSTLERVVPLWHFAPHGEPALSA